jgi:hypothetical protein
MAEQLQAMLDDATRAGTPDPGAPPANVIEGLRALGYVD